MTVFLAALITNPVPDRCWRPGLRSSRAGLTVSHFPCIVCLQTESPGGRAFRTRSHTWAKAHSCPCPRPPCLQSAAPCKVDPPGRGHTSVPGSQPLPCPQPTHSLSRDGDPGAQGVCRDVRDGCRTGGPLGLMLGQVSVASDLYPKERSHTFPLLPCQTKEDWTWKVLNEEPKDETVKPC